MLARAGARLTLIGRPGGGPHLDAIRAGGLTIDGVRVKETVPAEVADDPSAAAGADLVLFAVKTPETERAAAALAPHVGPQATVVCLQNGVDNVDRMRRAGVDALGCSVFIAAAVEAPGRIVHRARGDLVLGPDTEAARLVAARFEAAEVPCAVTDRIREALWQKLAINAMGNGISAVTGATYGEIVADERACRVATAIGRETVAVGRADGVDLDEAEVLRKGLETLRSVGAALASTRHDVVAGRPTENEALNGFVARRGAELGVPAPANEAVAAMLGLVERRSTGS